MNDAVASIGDGRFCGYSFRDPALLETALTHRSAARCNNERLEYLGDAVLGLVIARALFQQCGEVGEGDLTRLRAHLVRGRALAEIAREIGIGEALRLGTGELRSGGFRRDSILADALEAVLGAVLVDGGYEAASAVIHQLYRERLRTLPELDQLKDPKTRLQEKLQGAARPLPRYEVIEESGAEHERHFRVRCVVDDRGDSAEASGSSRRRAEQAAARKLLDALEADA